MNLFATLAFSKSGWEGPGPPVVATLKLASTCELMYLHDWTRQATSSTVCPMARFAKSVGAHRRDIVNRLLFRISSGPLEGLNNKNEVQKPNAYCYRQRGYFTLRILLINKAKHTFVG